MEYTEYARILDDGNIETTIVDNDEILAMRTSQGFLPLDRMDPPTEILPRGQCYAPRYRIDDGRCVQYWVIEQCEIPPQTYSKLKILLAAQQAGMGSAFINLLESNTMLKLIWDASNTIEDNELLDQYLPTIGQAIGKTPDEIKAFLDENCVVD